MRCVVCAANKPPASFTNCQKKRPAGARRCSTCSSAASSVAEHADGGAAGTGSTEPGAETAAESEPLAATPKIRAPAAATATSPDAPAAPLRAGVRVELVGLGTAGLNGQLATLSGLRANDRGRWAVTTDAGRSIAVKPANLRVIASKTGHGTTATGTNGTTAATPAAAGILSESTAAAADAGPPDAAIKVCAWSGCGRALSAGLAEQSKFKCGRCKQAFYCDRTCQKRHWGHGGHKEECTEPPYCNICLDGGDEPVPIQRVCACRGDAGLAHVACLAEVAARKSGGLHEGWLQCPTCGQRYTGAMDLGLQRALVHRMRTRRRDDPHRLGAESNLGNALRNAGKYDEAAEVLVRVLAVMKRAIGEDGEDTLRTANMLAATYQQQRKLAEAEELQVWVLEASGRVHGKEHPRTLDATTNLALTYYQQGKLAEAEELQVAVLEAWMRLRGEVHPRTLNATANLSNTYREQGKHAEAEELLAAALAVSRRVLGVEHPYTLRYATSLADTCMNLGKLTEAEELQVDTLAASRRVRGAVHPVTLHVARNLAHTYHTQGRDTDAEELRARYRL